MKIKPLFARKVYWFPYSKGYIHYNWEKYAGPIGWMHFETKDGIDRLSGVPRDKKDDIIKHFKSTGRILYARGIDVYYSETNHLGEIPSRRFGSNSWSKIRFDFTPDED